MSKRVELHNEHKKILKSVAKEAVADPSKYFTDSKDVQLIEKQKVKHSDKKVEEALYKQLKSDAKKTISNTQQDEGSDGKLEKFLDIMESVAKFLHKMVTPFVPIFVGIATAEANKAVMANQDIPEKYKAQFANATEEAISQVGDQFVNLNIGDGDEVRDIGIAGDQENFVEVVI